MLVIELTYLQPIAVVERWLTQHQNFLDRYFSSGAFIASGAKVPRDGGIILAMVNRDDIQSIIEQDPFYQHGVAEYRIREFQVSRSNNALTPLLD